MNSVATEVPENAFGYGAVIWSLFNQAPRAGRFPPRTPGVLRGQAGTPAARSVLRIELRVEGSTVIDAHFGAYGCPTSIAVGGWIATQSIGRTLAELRSITSARLRAALEIPDDRAHCALMGEDALRAALDQAERMQPP